MLNFIVNNRTEKLNKELKKYIEDNKERLIEAQAGEEKYSDSQGWLDTKEHADDDKIEVILEIAEEIKSKADTFVLIGVGGSNNAARAVIEALKCENHIEIIYAGNTLSPYAVNNMLRQLEGKSVYIDCIAKNFETLEPGATFRILRRYLEEKYGEEAKNRIIATGTYGSTLEQLCNDRGYRFIDFPMNIGGRYTAISNVGLLPMAVAGIDIREVVKGAADMQKRLHTTDYKDNIAYEYACLRNLFYNKGYRLEMLSSFEPQFSYFYKWWIQLFAESEGKDNKGIFPVTGEFSEELHSVGQFIQDGSPIIFETFLDVKKQNAAMLFTGEDSKDYFDYLKGKDFWDINKAAFKATIDAHSTKLPCLTIEIDAIDAYNFGQLFYFFQFACYLSCKIMGVNAFDQPGVEAYKKWMFAALGK